MRDLNVFRMFYFSWFSSKFIVIIVVVRFVLKLPYGALFIYCSFTMSQFT